MSQRPSIRVLVADDEPLARRGVRQLLAPHADMTVVGESRNFAGGIDWLRENGVEVVDLDNLECRELLAGYIAEHREVWNEDIGESSF